MEGHRGGTWILLDFSSVVVHIFNEEAQEFYDLERLWSDAAPVDLSGVLTEKRKKPGGTPAGLFARRGNQTARPCIYRVSGQGKTR